MKTKNATHTPGPWASKMYSHTNKCFVTDLSGRVLYEEITVDTETVSPTARLIAAAPELLEFACMILAEQIGHGPHGDAELIRRARELIARTTGEK